MWIVAYSSLDLLRRLLERPKIVVAPLTFALDRRCARMAIYPRRNPGTGQPGRTTLRRLSPRPARLRRFIKTIINLVDGQPRLPGAICPLNGGSRRTLHAVGGLGPLEQLAVVHARRKDPAREMADRLPI